MKTMEKMVNYTLWTAVSMIAGMLLVKFLSLKIMACIAGGLFLLFIGIWIGKGVNSSK